MDGILLFTTIVVLVFGVLQIVLFFKMWKMTNDVTHIKETISDNKKEGIKEDILMKAQICALDGEKEKSFNLYKEAFLMSIVELKERMSVESYAYKSEYDKVASFYSGKVEKLGGFKLDTQKYSLIKDINEMI